jgi:hypothetical protein
MTPTEIIAAVVQYIAYLVEQIKSWVTGALATAIGGIQAIMKYVGDFIANIASQISVFLRSLFDQFFGFMRDLLTPIVQWLHDAWDAIYRGTIEVLQTIGGFVDSMVAHLRSFAGEIIDTVVGWIAQATKAIEAIVEPVIAGIVGLVSAAKKTVEDFVGSIIAAVVKVLTDTMATLNAAWETLVTGAQAIIKTVGDRLAELKTAFGDAATEIVGAIGDVAEDQLGPIRDAVKAFVAHFMPDVDPARVSMMIAALEGTRTDPGQMEVFRTWYRDGFKDLAKRSGTYQTVFFFLFTVLSLLPSVWGIGQLFTKVSLQEWNARFPSELLPAADVASAWRHGIMDEKTAVETIKRQGYSEEDATTVLRITEQVPGPGDLMALRLRGIIEDNAVEDALKVQGFTSVWAQRLAKAAQIIPPVQDLITMGVRDVWNSATRSLGRLEEDYPKELGEWTEKQGLTPDWALKYWAAHWSLPSPQQGFEMMHRGVITPEELAILLQALDVAPGWRDKLTAIAFNPYTRVDIRRMHAMKLLTDAEVLQAHRDLGYDEDKAQKLTAFVLHLNKTSVTEDDVELGRLSRTSILGFYQDGVIAQATAIRLLQDLGHTLEAASLYVSAIDMDDQRNERKSNADLIIEQAEAGTLTFEDAQDKLRGLGLETVEVEKAITRLLRAQQRKLKLPSQADGQSFYAAGLIQRGDYDDLLGRLGYAPKWRVAYIALAEKKKNAGAKSSGA